MDFAERVLESGILHRQTDRAVADCVDACTHAVYPPSNPDAKGVPITSYQNWYVRPPMPDLLEMVENRLGLRKSGGADILRGQKLDIAHVGVVPKFSCYVRTPVDPYGPGDERSPL